VKALEPVLMSGLAVTIVATVFDAVKGVSSTPIWEQTLKPAAFVERRKQNLPYIGAERRRANMTKTAEVATIAAVVQRRRKAA